MNQEQNRILLVSILLRCQKTESKKYILINVIVIVFIVWVSILPRREVCHDSHLRVFRVWFGREPRKPVGLTRNGPGLIIGALRDREPKDIVTSTSTERQG